MDLRERVHEVRPGADDPLLRRALANVAAALGSEGGRRLGRYRLIRRLGAGGFGTVWQARDPLLGRDVAIKVLHRDLGELHLAQVRREAQSLAAVSHPNVVTCFDVGVDGDTAYLAMQLVVGCDLATWLHVDRADRAILRVFAEAAAGLAAAHALGIVHRDVKPANILIPVRGAAAVTDFGVARAWHDARTLSDDDDGPTQVSAVAGTLLYMAPEQQLGRPPTPAADVFALAASLYEAFAGVPAFVGRTHTELLERKLARELCPPRRGRGLPSRVHDAVLRGLDPDPRGRPSANALVPAALPRRRGAAVLGVALSVAPLAALAGLSHDDPCAIELASRTDAAADELALAVENRRDVLAAIRGEACSGFAAGELARAEVVARLACVDGRLRDLDAFVAAADTTTRSPSEAVLALAELPTNEPCVASPVVDDRDDAERAALMRARAATRGDATAARDAATWVLARAGADGRGRLQAEALVLRGMASFTLLDAEAAIDDLRQGFWMAMGTGDDRVAAQAAVWLVGAFGRIEAYAEADEWARHADALLERVAEAEAMYAWLELHRGANAAERGDVAAAIAADARMMAAWRRVAARDGVSLAQPWLQSSETLLAARRLDEAQHAAERARASLDSERDPSPVLAMQLQLASANVAFMRGERLDAIAVYRAVLPAITAAVEPADMRATTARRNLASLLLRAGQFAEARERVASEVERIRALPGAHDGELPRLLAQLGHLDHMFGEGDRGRAHLHKAAVIFDELSPRLDSLIAYGGLAELAANEGDHAAAVKWMERGLTVVEALLPEEHPARIRQEANTWAARAMAVGDHVAFARVAALRDHIATVDRAALDLNTAAAYREHGDFRAAERLDREALAAAMQIDEPRELAHARYSLAESIAGAQGDPAEVARLRADACAYFRALATYEDNPARGCDKLLVPPGGESH